MALLAKKERRTIEVSGAVSRGIGAPTLDVIGNTELLGRNSIGICGSRNSSDEGLRYAYQFGQEAARHGFVVVSGYARGVDSQAHLGALEAGGETIAVLPEGADSFSVRRELRPVANPDNFLAVSMFPAESRWTAWRAMERNKLIVALSSGLFVVEARDKGGTINAAKECVKQRKPLWAVAYSNESEGRNGNKKLLLEWAIPLKCMSDVKRALREMNDVQQQDIRQLALNLAD